MVRLADLLAVDSISIRGSRDIVNTFEYLGGSRRLVAPVNPSIPAVPRRLRIEDGLRAMDAKPVRFNLLWKLRSDQTAMRIARGPQRQSLMQAANQLVHAGRNEIIRTSPIAFNSLGGTPTKVFGPLREDSLTSGCQAPESSVFVSVKIVAEAPSTHPSVTPKEVIKLNEENGVCYALRDAAYVTRAQLDGAVIL